MKKHKWIWLASLLLAAALLASAALAQETKAEVDLNRTGSITITLQRDGRAVSPPSTFHLYQVAQITGSGTGQAYTLTADFAASGAALDDLEAAGLADRLDGYVKGKGLSGTTGQTDHTGTLTFSDLPVGLYLLVQEEGEGGYYAVKPFLASVPLAVDGEELSYDVDASPKMQWMEAPPDPVDPDPPGPVDPDPPRPPRHTPTPSAEPTPTVTPTASPEPTASPTPEPTATPTAVPTDGPGPSAPPDVDPPVPTPTPTDPNWQEDLFPTMPSEPPGEGLIQTGPIIWPIPVLALVGLALFALGWVLVFGKRGGSGDED